MASETLIKLALKLGKQLRIKIQKCKKTKHEIEAGKYKSIK